MSDCSTDSQDALDYRRVEKAIRFLDHHRDEQPRLEEIADHVGLSKYHFHRLFTRWAGTTPKRFLQHLTVEKARRLLRESESVLSAAFGSGLSGGGRLHDHFVTVESVTPGEVRSGGTGLTIHTGIHASPFGDAFIAATDRGICFLAFLPSESSPTRRSGERSARRELADLWPEADVASAPEVTQVLARRAFGTKSVSEDGEPEKDRGSEEGGEKEEDGKGVGLRGQRNGREGLEGDVGNRTPVPVHLRGTNFQIQVWRALLRIPPGHATSYGRLASLMDRSGSARAVGSAVARNPVAYLIPCHRVIRETGEFGGYRWGGERKRLMLGREVGPRP